MSGCGNRRGQILPYFLVLIVILVISWAMLLNIAQLLMNRMMMQNAADNAALSVAVQKARVMNTLGLLNYAIASTLYGPESGRVSGFLSYYRYAIVAGLSGTPLEFPLSCAPMGGIPPGCYPPGKGAVDNQKKVAAFLDLLPGSNGTRFIMYVRKMVTALVGCQDILRTQFDSKAYPHLLATEIGRRQGEDQNGNATGSDLVIVKRGMELGLLRNKNGVVYHRSEKLDGIAAKTAILAVNVFLKAALGSPVDIREVFEAQQWNEAKQSWLYADRHRFARRQKIIVIAQKTAASPSNRGYPLFGSWLGITWPSMTTVAAAGIYNDGGPMFPLEERDRPSDRISPVIREYKRARYHGWDAHLVPLGGAFRH